MRYKCYEIELRNRVVEGTHHGTRVTEDRGF